MKILGMIGGGFMAHAIADGAGKSGFLKKDEILIGEPDLERRRALAAEGYSVTESNDEAAACPYLLFAVKPQSFGEVAERLSVKPNIALTIMAGKTKAAIRAKLSLPDLKIARAMPNLPCSVGAGVIGLDSSELCGREKEFVQELFSSVGTVTEVDESRLNAVTGVSGSGPAYVWLFLQALQEAGIAEGLDGRQARALAAGTLAGALEVLKGQPERELSDLIAAVSSKGGTTVAALSSLERDGFTDSVKRAVHAACVRAEELQS